MSQDDHDIDDLLQQNSQRQLAGFDWDRQRQMVRQRVAAGRMQKSRRGVAIGVASGIAALLLLAGGYVCIKALAGMGRDATSPREIAADHASGGSDSLLASTETTTILLTGPARWLALNDPALTPPSRWGQ